MDANNRKIATLWQVFDEAVNVNYKQGERAYGVYYDYQSDYSGSFTVLAGFDGKLLPENIILK